MPISPNEGNMEKLGEKYVQDFESLRMACLRQNIINNSGNSHIVGIDKIVVSPIEFFEC